MILMKKNEHGEEFKVPLKMQQADLHVKLYLQNDFPQSKPIVQVMAHVSHPNVDSSTFQYTGPAIQHFTPQSYLTILLKAIHDDFLANPPVPVSMVQ